MDTRKALTDMLRRIPPLRTAKQFFCFMILMSILLINLRLQSRIDDECILSYYKQITTGECVYINTTIKADIKYTKTKSWRLSKPKHTITLFTTFDIEMQKRLVYENTMKSWKRLPNIKTILFYGDEKTRLLGKRFNWTVYAIPKIVCGTPVLRSMFEVAQEHFESDFYGYANADLLFSSDLLTTLESVKRSSEFNEGPIILSGRRTDVNVSALEDQEVKTEDDLIKMVRNGKLSHDMSADYYITNKLFLWKYVPDIVVGRPIVDNWLIWYSRLTDCKIIDATFTVLAVHQRAVGFVKKVSFCNHKVAKQSGMLPRIPIWKGSTECSTHSAVRTSKDEILFMPKVRLLESCNWRNIIYEK